MKVEIICVLEKTALGTYESDSSERVANVLKNAVSWPRNDLDSTLSILRKERWENR